MRWFQGVENTIWFKKSEYVTTTVTMNDRKSCRQFRKKVTLKTEVRPLKIVMKNVKDFDINVLNIFFFKWKNIVKLCLVFQLDMYFSDCFATNDQSSYPSVGEIKKSFDFFACKRIFFFHGNGFTPVWLVGTEKTLSNASENSLAILSW